MENVVKVDTWMDLPVKGVGDGDLEVSQVKSVKDCTVGYSPKCTVGYSSNCTVGDSLTKGVEESSLGYFGIRGVNHSLREGGFEEGVVVRGSVNGCEVVYTVDTGASRTIISTRVYDKIPQAVRSRLIESANIVGARGASIRGKGRAEFEITLGSLKMRREVLVADIEDEALLGYDVLKGSDGVPADILLSQKEILLNGLSVPLLRVDSGKHIRRVVGTEDVGLQGQHEAVVHVEAFEESGERCGDFVVEPGGSLRKCPMPMTSSLVGVNGDPTCKSYDRGASNAVSPYITLSILVAGVLGGLVIVIAFILFCKYCVKKKHSQRRDQGTSCERQSDRRFKPFQRIETINSDVFSEPSTGSMDGIPISPRKLLEAKSHEKLFPPDEPNENTKLKSDFDKTSYRETDLDLEQLTSEVTGNDVEDAEGAGSENQDASSGRRVSFQLENISPTHTGYLQKGRRYTEGDFHYLKKIRINKNQVPRQYSLGVQMGRNVNDKCIDIIELDTIPAAEEPSTDVYVDMETSMSTIPRVHHQALDSPSPPDHNVGPRLVDVEIHSRTDPRNNRIQKDTGSSRSSPINSISRSPRLVDRAKYMKPISHSLDAMTHSRSTARSNRRVKSYDDVLEYDYDVLKITEFSSGPFHNNHFDPISEVEALGSSKVRYNDMGSLEVLNEEKLYMYDDYEFENNIIPDESDADTETTLNGAQKYREIWNLRTTLEEEEECSDTVRMEDMASPDDEASPGTDLGGASYSPTYHHVNEVPAQYHNNGELGLNNGHIPRGLIGFGELPQAELGDANLLHPNYEQRRDSYKKVLNRRYQKRGSASAENSFDSVETVDTDGDVSDTSRQEVTTTSFESTTDNTDSTNDSTNKLRQMKADSGYKSLETPLSNTQNGSAKKSQSMDDEIVVLESSIQSASKSDEVLEGVGASEIVPRRGSIFEKRRGRTASKRRREYSKERHVVRLYESVYEPETDSARSDQPSGDSFEEPNTPSTKFSVFSRFFKSQKFSREKGLSRDFSIDEKTNNLFQEFVRYDPKFDSGHRGSTAGLKLGPESRRQRMQRKYTDPGPYVYDEISRHWLTPEMRSTSLGSDSSASSARKISPQDSIEEEIEDDIDAAVMDHKRLLEEKQLLDDKTSNQSKATTPTVSLHEIPIIKLPEGETVDV